MAQKDKLSHQETEYSVGTRLTDQASLAEGSWGLFSRSTMVPMGVGSLTDQDSVYCFYN